MSDLSASQRHAPLQPQSPTPRPNASSCASLTHLDSLPNAPHLSQTPLCPSTSLDLLFLAVQPEPIGSLGLLDDFGRSEGAEVILREGDREGRVGREDERSIALAPAIVVKQSWSATPL
jgi:hypothetical protein